MIQIYYSEMLDLLRPKNQQLKTIKIVQDEYNLVEFKGANVVHINDFIERGA